MRRLGQWVLRGAAGLALAAGLSACNLVITTEPTYTAADAAGAPAMKDGLWVSVEKGCDVDLKKPATEWPECAGWIVVKDGAMTGVGDDGQPFKVPFVLAAGDPRVMQIELQEKGDGPKLFMYIGVKPVKSDGEGRIIEYTGWIVQCGPPPPKDSKREDGQPRFGTLEPSPGMVMDEQQSGCTPSSKAALTGAAKLSERYELSEPRGEATRWVRDGDK
ncbi:hypothetical protein GVN21_05865 [Caulobacter sp. SLTY]|uniref:hypothetical protein n=1 Tax=Caulobacter sp. SLTY TaxID=2683262 RepID=UPI00141299D6|nr:hypothetical protein [Caulobacter sp. SLTY]NBB14890.1 hypothetical protein [Caulobacter sp. SLTY]